MEKKEKKSNSSSISTITWLQKIALYETKARFFVVGSNNTQSRFRVIKIDRTEKTDLVVIDDKVEYSQPEIREMLTRIDIGNRQGKSSTSSAPGVGLNRTISAFGIVGFVRFVSGYYLILITKRRRVAQIGHHIIYKIEDTHMIYIPSETEKSNHDETKYVKMFQNVDLSSNFYFSYSYDLSHTLQYNLTPCNQTQLNSSDNNGSENVSTSESKTKSEPIVYRTKPTQKFVWNSYLLNNVDLHPDWMIHIIHGFISQTNISVFGRPLYFTLIARRSQKYAGTRFLKRGANCEGDVANEVETEQILHDSSVSSFEDGRYTSFVQMRGSVPSFWSQDISKMVPKPPIGLDVVDPYFYTAGRHFNQLLYRFGSPIIVLNLVKRREQKPHESVLSDEYINSISYLNQFLSPEHHIEHIGFDMARINKLTDNVMSRLSDIAYYAVQNTGIFQSWPRTGAQQIRQQTRRPCGGYTLPNGRILQTGITRVNCVDCLDRTNTAQFALGKVALAYQLYAFGVINKPELEFETDTVRMLEELYEDHGDTLALQYGGSQLVHRIKTYRKIAPLSSHSRDIMQTLSRYYSNTFSDADKQNAMNLFLGIYKAYMCSISLPSIWELSTDFYLHHSTAGGKLHGNSRQSYTCWWDDEVAACIPRSALEVYKGTPGTLLSSTKDFASDETTDGFYEQYRPYELTVFADSLAFNILHTIKDFMPNFTAEYSPFCVRIRPGKRRESLMGSTGSKLPPPNPSLSGHASTSSTSSVDSDVESDSGEDDDANVANYRADSAETEESSLSHGSPVKNFESVLTNSKQKYGILYKMPDDKDISIYDKYANSGVASGERTLKTDEVGLSGEDRLISVISGDSSFSVEKPKISVASVNVYREYLRRATLGASTPPKASLDLYIQYVINMTESC